MPASEAAADPTMSLAASIVASIALLAPAFDDERYPLGEAHFEISATDAAQAEFDRGIVLLHHMTYEGAREAFEREYLLTQINRFGGNISRTAEFVGMERSALHRKLKSLGVVTSAKAGNRVAHVSDAEEAEPADS